MDCGCWATMSGGRQLRDHNLVELTIVGMGFYYYYYFIWVCLGLGRESYDVGYLELFGFEEDEWVVIGVVVDGSCCLAGSHDSLCCGFGFCFEIFFIWVCLRFDVGWLIS